MSVWLWFARDATLAEDLVFAAAVPTYRELAAIAGRLGLPTPAAAGRLMPFERGFAEAARTPGRLLWMPLAEFSERASAWRSEEQLKVRRLAGS